MRIVPDPATNSLIIYGTAQEFQNIKNILKELDSIPRQVLINALVLQVDLNDAEDFGVDYEILKKSRVTIFGQTFGSRGAVRSLGDLFPSTGSFGSGLSGIVGGNNVSAFINALMSDSRVKLLSAPSVLATDNRPARIQVGSEEPLPTGNVTSSEGISTTTTIQYRNTGRILTIIPQVNSQGLVNLQIKAEISARGDDVLVGGESFPAFNTQDAETTAVVHDGETLVIGGLIGERKSKSRAGIPYLMDIPVIGRFFGTTSDESRRQELIMLITPRVIRNKEESRSVTEEFKAKLSTLKNELERQNREREKKNGQSQDKPLAPPPSSSVTPDLKPGNVPAPKETSTERLRSISVPTEDFRPRIPERPGSEAARPKSSIPAARPVAEMEAAVRSEKTEEPVVVIPPLPSSPSGKRESAARAAQTDATVKPVIKPPTRQWVVQVAAFTDANDAEHLAKSLKDKKYDAFVVIAEVRGKTWHRVRVGRLTSWRDARELQKKLQSSEKIDQTFIASR